MENPYAHIVREQRGQHHDRPPISGWILVAVAAAAMAALDILTRVQVQP